MINLSRIQLELERAKEGLREVEETIQKVEGKTFINGPGRYNNLKVQIHSDKNRGLISNEDGKLQRRSIASNIEPRNRRISSDDLSFSLKRGPRDKRDMGMKRQMFDGRPPSIAARLSGISQQSVDDEDDEEFTKKLTIPSRVITTVAETPSRQEIIAAQTGDEVVKERNRRMFGALVGTLQKFCKEETRVREREEKRLRVEKKLEEDAKREKEKLMQEKRELFLERKRREIEIKRIEWSLNRVKEYEAWEAHVLPLKNFIQTHAKPHIFYLPNTHNSKTEERLLQSQKLVERMIEKRKNNLKEEIENSERKAKRTVADEEEEEEAENIPQNPEPVQNAEQGVGIDFDGVKKENGFHEEGDSKTQEDSGEQSVQAEESEKDGTWREKTAEPEEKANSDGENEKEASTDETAEATTAEEEPKVSNDMCGPSEADESGRNKDESASDGRGEENTDTGEGRTFDAKETNESVDKKESETEEEAHEVPVTERAREEETAKCQAASQESGDVTGKCEEDVGRESGGEVKKDDDPGKASEETKKDRDKTPEKKLKRSYRSPRRSRSPRRFAKTRRRSRSSSRRRKSYRRRSRSHSKSGSPTKRSRRLRRRPERTSSLRKKSPRRRRSSSKSSSSASPRKRMKYRSPSYSSSRSDSD